MCSKWFENAESCYENLKKIFFIKIELVIDIKNFFRNFLFYFLFKYFTIIDLLQFEDVIYFILDTFVTGFPAFSQ